VANQADQILQAVTASIRLEVGELRTFIDRRLAELSAEVHASVELMDMGETHLSGQLGGIREQLANLSSMPVSTTRTVGSELQAVVQATEAATIRILTAAEAINIALQCSPVALDRISAGVSDIFEACTVQDVTGQRIHRAIDHLRQVETLLSDLTADPVSTEPAEASAGTDLPQDAIDSLFS
jgi:chemotaxis protein CheZ